MRLGLLREFCTASNEHTGIVNEAYLLPRKYTRSLRNTDAPVLWTHNNGLYGVCIRAVPLLPRMNMQIIICYKAQTIGVF